ncbi:unnamed protein product, partial [marine sediment metagenome]
LSINHPKKNELIIVGMFPIIKSRAICGSEAEYFSFYSIGGKFSAILGPVTFGLVSYFTKSQRIALLSTLFFLVSGLIIIQFVKVPKRRPGLLHY